MATAYCSSLLINVHDLLSLQGVENQRVEFKKAWHGKRNGGTYWQVIHTICAFANDYYNDNGGYIIIGVEEKENWEHTADDRQIILPPFGVTARDLDRIQKEIMGACRANIKPEYFPILSPEVVDTEGTKRHVLVIWAMASDNRPHTCRESEKGENLYYIRRATETKKASSDEVRQLLALHSKIPFDDRRALDLDSGKQLSEADIDLNLVKSFLKGIGSKLLEQLEQEDEKPPNDVYQKLKLVRYVGDRKDGQMLVKVFVPRNVALLFFHPTPHDFFAGAKTEIATYTHDGDVTEESAITGPIDVQIAKILTLMLETTKEEARQFVAYPARALLEAVVNAFHHRGYEACDSNPVKIHIKPNCIDIISYPGPNSSLTPDHFLEGNEVPPVPSRNRRIAEFLKERKLAEGRFTGVKTIYRSMKNNNNPKPSFLFDQSYFSVRLPGHPKYITYSILRDADILCAKGDKQNAIKSIRRFLDEHLTDEPSFYGSEMVISKLLELHDNDMTHPNIQPYKAFIPEKLERRIPLIAELSKWCAAKEIQDISTGVKIVKRLVEEGAKYEDLKSVVTKAVKLYKERSAAGQLALPAVQNAHKLFEAMGEISKNNSYVAYHFACSKFHLYRMTAHNARKRKNLVSILKDAEDHINNAIQLTNKESKHSLAKRYRLLGYIHSQLLIIQKSTKKQVIGFYEMAREYNPGIKINEDFIPDGYHNQFRPDQTSFDYFKGFEDHIRRTIESILIPNLKIEVG